MAPQQKIFISYSTQDHETAASLYSDLTKAGADVFQFQKSATPGQAAWDEALTRIEHSNIFLLLASKHALKSKPVIEEMKTAHYLFVNEDIPSVLLPLILEPGLRLPLQVRINTNISFIDYDKGINELITFLKLEKLEKIEAKTELPKDIKTAPKTIPKTIPRKPARNPLPKYSPPTNLQKKGSLKDRYPEAFAKYATSSPANLNLDSRPIIIAKYSLTIALVALAVIGLLWWLTPSLLQYGNVPAYIEKYSGVLNSWSLNWTWVPLVSKIIFAIITAIITYNKVDYDIPIDIWEYAFVTLSCVGLALLVALGWSFLFLQSPLNITSYMYISIGVAALTVIYYAIFEDYLV